MTPSGWLIAKAWAFCGVAFLANSLAIGKKCALQLIPTCATTIRSGLRKASLVNIQMKAACGNTQLRLRKASKRAG